MKHYQIGEKFGRQREFRIQLCGLNLSSNEILGAHFFDYNIFWHILWCLI